MPSNAGALVECVTQFGKFVDLVGDPPLYISYGNA